MAAHLKPGKSVPKAILFENLDPRHHAHVVCSHLLLALHARCYFELKFNTCQWTFVLRTTPTLKLLAHALKLTKNEKLPLPISMQSVNVLRPEGMYLVVMQGQIQDFQKGGGTWQWSVLRWATIVGWGSAEGEWGKGVPCLLLEVLNICKALEILFLILALVKNGWHLNVSKHLLHCS